MAKPYNHWWPKEIKLLKDLWERDRAAALNSFPRHTRGSITGMALKCGFRTRGTRKVWTQGEKHELERIWEIATKSELKRRLPRFDFEVICRQARILALPRRMFQKHTTRSKISIIQELVQRRLMLRLERKVYAERSGYSLTHISRIERGDYRPSLAVLITLAETLGCVLTLKVK